MLLVLVATYIPSPQPTNQPTNQPTIQPTIQPSNHPTIQPSNHPTIQPSDNQTILGSEPNFFVSIKDLAPRWTMTTWPMMPTCSCCCHPSQASNGVAGWVFVRRSRVVFFCFGVAWRPLVFHLLKVVRKKFPKIHAFKTCLCSKLTRIFYGMNWLLERWHHFSFLGCFFPHSISYMMWLRPSC